MLPVVCPSRSLETIEEQRYQGCVAKDEGYTGKKIQLKLLLLLLIVFVVVNVASLSVAVVVKTIPEVPMLLVSTNVKILLMLTKQIRRARLSLPRTSPFGMLAKPSVPQ